MDLFAFIRTADPTKVRIGERQRGEDEPKLLDTTVGRTVPLNLVAPARAESELDASVDKLFDEEGSGNQEEQNYSAGGDQGAGIQFVSEAVEKLRDDHGVPGGPFVGGKSRPAIQHLLAGAVLNVEVRGEIIPTLPFVTSSVSTTPEHEEGDHIDSIARDNLCTIGASQRFVISSDSSHHSGTHVAETEVDSFIRSSTPAMITATSCEPQCDIAA
ncbi:hypothetical protein Tco_0178918 [Tanacetum coccineum]